jgi:hypothetical protein
MKVIDIEDYKEAWIAAKCLCVSCCHIWVSIVHENKQNKLECPECKEMKGAVISYIEDE